MKIEILCNGCGDCDEQKGKVSQAASDLNLDADVYSDHDPKKHVTGLDCNGVLRLRLNGLLVSTKSDCNVRDLMLLLNKELHMQQ